mmetsp:Transcript_34917/g.110298  ORF Transcript_34917/g.110298 Transcript_34917/m.110298 type:complete len:232 (-) Transcript_34917:1387-2082(-)
MAPCTDPSRRIPPPRRLRPAHTPPTMGSSSSSLSNSCRRASTATRPRATSISIPGSTPGSRGGSTGPRLLRQLQGRTCSTQRRGRLRPRGDTRSSTGGMGSSPLNSSMEGTTSSSTGRLQGGLQGRRHQWLQGGPPLDTRTHPTQRPPPGSSSIRATQGTRGSRGTRPTPTTRATPTPPPTSLPLPLPLPQPMPPPFPTPPPLRGRAPLSTSWMRSRSSMPRAAASAPRTL